MVCRRRVCSHISSQRGARPVQHILRLPTIVGDLLVLYWFNCAFPSDGDSCILEAP